MAPFTNAQFFYNPDRNKYSHNKFDHSGNLAAKIWCQINKNYKKSYFPQIINALLEIDENEINLF